MSHSEVEEVEEDVDMSLVADVVFDDDIPDEDEAARGNKVFDECFKIFNEAQEDSVSSSSTQQKVGSCYKAVGLPSWMLAYPAPHDGHLILQSSIRSLNFRLSSFQFNPSSSASLNSVILFHFLIYSPGSGESIFLDARRG